MERDNGEHRVVTSQNEGQRVLLVYCLMDRAYYHASRTSDPVAEFVFKVTCFSIHGLTLGESGRAFRKFPFQWDRLSTVTHRYEKYKLSIDESLFTFVPFFFIAHGLER
jgi:hypothetical protein